MLGTQTFLEALGCDGCGISSSGPPCMLNLAVYSPLNIILEEASRGTVAVGAGPQKVVVSCQDFFVDWIPSATAAAASARTKATSAFVSVAVGAWWGVEVAHPVLLHLSLPLCRGVFGLICDLQLQSSLQNIVTEGIAEASECVMGQLQPLLP